MYLYSSLGCRRSLHNQRGQDSGDNVLARHFSASPRAERIKMIACKWPIVSITGYHHSPEQEALPRWPQYTNGLGTLCSCNSVCGPPCLEHTKMHKTSMPSWSLLFSGCAHHLQFARNTMWHRTSWAMISFPLQWPLLAWSLDTWKFLFSLWELNTTPAWTCNLDIFFIDTKWRQVEMRGRDSSGFPNAGSCCTHRVHRREWN